MIIKHYNSRTAQTENNSELELVKIELELKNTKAIAQVKSASIALNTALFVNNIHQVRFNPYSYRIILENSSNLFRNFDFPARILGISSNLVMILDKFSNGLCCVSKSILDEFSRNCSETYP